jgi:uncharacterized protein YkwD
MSRSPLVRSSAVLLLSAAALVVGPLVQPAAASVSGRYEHSVNIHTNDERGDRQLTPLKKSACLDRYAERQARAMAKKKKMYHQKLGPILSKCHLRGVGENVAFGFTTGEAVTAGWMASPPHRENLLNPDHRLIGVGAYQDSHGWWYVSQVLGVHR